MGLSDRFAGDRYSENRYRQERRELGEEVPHRTTYNLIGDEAGGGRSDSEGENEAGPLLEGSEGY